LESPNRSLIEEYEAVAITNRPPTEIGRRRGTSAASCNKLCITRLARDKREREIKKVSPPFLPPKLPPPPASSTPRSTRVSPCFAPSNLWKHVCATLAQRVRVPARSPPECLSLASQIPPPEPDGHELCVGQGQEEEGLVGEFRRQTKARALAPGMIKAPPNAPPYSLGTVYVEAAALCAHSYCNKRPIKSRAPANVDAAAVSHSRDATRMSLPAKIGGGAKRDLHQKEN